MPSLADQLGAAGSQGGTSFDKATADLALTPQEQNLYQFHLNNLWSGGGFVHPYTGDVSTLLQSVVQGPDKRYYNVPTVWDGKQHSDDEAYDHAASIGWSKFPAYASPDIADARYEKMHEYLGQDVELWRYFHHPVDTMAQPSIG